METVIASPGGRLKSNRASYCKKLLPGATDEEARQLEQPLGLPLPESL